MDRIIEGEGMHYEGNCIRPPSEAYSILLQVTIGCSHNKCTFCGTYKDKRFQIKDDQIILSDILFASKYMKRQDRVFLMDGDALIIPQKRLMWILDRINEHIPWVRRVGAYANAKTGQGRRKELERLRKAGKLTVEIGMVLNAGHGLNYRNVIPVAGIPRMNELNIGHSIIARAAIYGLDQAVRDIRQKMVQARTMAAK